MAARRVGTLSAVLAEKMTEILTHKEMASRVAPNEKRKRHRVGHRFIKKSMYFMEEVVSLCGEEFEAIAGGMTTTEEEIIRHIFFPRKPERKDEEANRV